MLRIKSEKPNNKLIKKIEEIFSSIKNPVIIIGIEKKSDRKSGIKINPNGIKILKVSSKVIE